MYVFRMNFNYYVRIFVNFNIFFLCKEILNCLLINDLEKIILILFLNGLKYFVNIYDIV